MQRGKQEQEKSKRGGGVEGWFEELFQLKQKVWGDEDEEEKVGMEGG